MRTPRPNTKKRRGAHLVELAIAMPVLSLLVIGFLVMGAGVSRYQQLAAAAREAARWASVHGKQYQRDTGHSAATASDVYNQIIAPRLVGFDSSAVSYAVTWNTSNEPFHGTINSNGNVIGVRNIVTVQVSYQWTPEGFFAPATLTSTSAMPMSY